MLKAIRFAGHDALRLRSDFAALFFSIALPVFFYFVFGAAQDYANVRLPGGNVGAFVMIGMSLYAGITGAVGAAGTVATEQRTGWGRQLALTPLTTAQIAFANLTNIVIRAALPVIAVFIAGACSGAELDGINWLTCLVLSIVLSIPFGFYGLIWAQLLPSENSVSIASSSIVVLAFAGNLFILLEGTMLEIAKFTPLYGAQSLARWPVTNQGVSVALVNIAVWTTIFVGTSVLLRRRDKNRA